MTNISGIGATQGGSGVIGGAADSALGGLDGDAFLQLLVAQLRFQNPMDPGDPSDLMLQTAQLTQLENTQQMVALQRQELGLQEATMAAGLVGKDVTGTDADGAEVTGVVDTVRWTTAGPVLDIGGTEVALGDVTEIRHVEPAPVEVSLPDGWAPPSGDDTTETGGDGTGSSDSDEPTGDAA